MGAGNSKTFRNGKEVPVIMFIADILFYIFATILVISSVAVVSVRNPVYSVLLLIFAFFNSAGLFLLLGAEFIAMLMVIVYVGAVAVLFLFIVMMLNINFAELRAGFIKYLPLGLLVAAVMLAELVMALEYSLNGKYNIAKAAVPFVKNLDNTRAIGMVLYTDYAYPFQIAGIVLLVAMIGAIVLTHRKRPGVRKQNVTSQVARSPKDCLEIVKVQSGKGV